MLKEDLYRYQTKQRYIPQGPNLKLKIALLNKLDKRNASQHTEEAVAYSWDTAY